MHLIIYFIIAHLFLLIPSFGITNRFLSKRVRNGLLLVTITYGVSLVFFGGVSSFSYLIGISNTATRVVLLIYIAYGTGLFLYDKAYRKLCLEWFGIGAVFLCSLFASIYISLPYSSSSVYVPDPVPRGDRNYETLNVRSLNLSKTQANDNYIPYRQAQFIINKSNVAKDSFIEEWGVHFFQRTPLMGAVTASYLLTLNDTLPIDYTWSNKSQDPGQTYLKFQLLSHILNSLFLLPSLLLITRIFSRKTALLTVLFLVPSQFFLYNNIFSWPKTLTAFFVLLSFYFLLSTHKKAVLAAAIVAGFGYLVHDLVILYIVAGFIYLITQKRVRDGLLYLFIPALFALPWIFLSKILLGRPSSFILYPFSLKEIPQTTSFSEVFNEFTSTSPITIIKIKLESLFYLLTPYQLIYEEGAQIGRRLWATSIFTVPGALGLHLILPFLIAIWKKTIQNRLLILMLGPVLFGVLFIGWPKGIGALHFAQASIVMLTATAIHFLSNYKKGIFLIPVYLLGLFQLVVFIIFSFDYHIEEWFVNYGSLMRVFLLATIPIVCSFGIVLLARQNTRQK